MAGGANGALASYWGTQKMGSGRNACWWWWSGALGERGFRSSFTIELRNAEGGTAFGEWEEFARCRSEIN